MLHINPDQHSVSIQAMTFKDSSINYTISTNSQTHPEAQWRVKVLEQAVNDTKAAHSLKNYNFISPHLIARGRENHLDTHVHTHAEDSVQTHTVKFETMFAVSTTAEQLVHTSGHMYSTWSYLL